jgi:predicted nucleic acid-binding protein
VDAMIKCLDTYALVEVIGNNPAYEGLIDDTTVITDIILAEFFYTLSRKHDVRTAEFWQRRFEPYCRPVTRDILLQSVRFRLENRKENLSFFDCVGYIYAREHGMRFVTGDRAFKGKKGVLYIP